MASREIVSVITDLPTAVEVHRRWAARQAVEKMVGGPLPYNPDVHQYFPHPEDAVQILAKSLLECLAMEALDNES